MPRLRSYQRASNCSSSRMFATQLSAVPPVITRRVLRVVLIRCCTMWKSASSKTSCTAAALSTRSTRDRRVRDVLDAEHRVRVPHALGQDRLADHAGKPLRVRRQAAAAMPVGERPVEEDPAVAAEDEHVAELVRSSGS